MYSPGLERLRRVLATFRPGAFFFQGDGGDDLQEQLQIDVSFYVISLRHVRFFFIISLPAAA